MSLDLSQEPAADPEVPPPGPPALEYPMPWYAYLWTAFASFVGTLAALAVVIWFIGRVQDDLERDLRGGL